MQQTVVHRGSYTETTIAIAKQFAGSVPQSGRKRIRLGFPVLQPRDSAVLGNQESAVVFDQGMDPMRCVGDRIELRWTRLPSPHARRPSRPEIASAILI